MSQDRRDDLAIYLGLQGFEVEGVAVVMPPRGPAIKVIGVRRCSGLYRCPDCGRGHEAKLFSESEPIRFRDCSIGTSRPTWKCVRCGWPAAAGRVWSACRS